MSNFIYITIAAILLLIPKAYAQSELETLLCEGAKEQRVIELVYDKDKSKGCEPRIVDIHQVAIGKNGQFYLRGYQHRGCTKGRDFAAARIFRLDKIKSANLIDGAFKDKSPEVKQKGWDGCLGSNCFIDKITCE